MSKEVQDQIDKYIAWRKVSKGEDQVVYLWDLKLENINVLRKDEPLRVKSQQEKQEQSRFYYESAKLLKQSQDDLTISTNQAFANASSFSPELKALLKGQLRMRDRHDIIVRYWMKEFWKHNPFYGLDQVGNL